MNILYENYAYRILETVPDLNEFNVDFNLKITNSYSSQPRAVLATALLGTRYVSDIVTINLIYVEFENLFMLLLIDHNNIHYQVTDYDHIITILEFIYETPLTILDERANHIFNLFKLGIAQM